MAGDVRSLEVSGVKVAACVQDTDENRIAHLEVIQGVIGRMAQQSFLLKGWAVTLVAAVIAFAASDGKESVAFLALLPALVFWGLDGYYLWQERLFRCIYNRVRTEQPGTFGDQVFTMDTSPHKSKWESWIVALCRPTVAIFHGAVVTAIVAGIIVLITQGGASNGYP